MNWRVTLNFGKPRISFVRHISFSIQRSGRVEVDFNLFEHIFKMSDDKKVNTISIWLFKLSHSVGTPFCRDNEENEIISTWETILLPAQHFDWNETGICLALILCYNIELFNHMFEILLWHSFGCVHRFDRYRYWEYFYE